eukprot:7955930-Alexandrium_andersonii.AAC.1
MPVATVARGMQVCAARCLADRAPARALHAGAVLQRYTLARVQPRWALDRAPLSAKRFMM